MNETLKLFEDAGAVITNSHIVYTSGKHGSAYINKDAIYPNTETISLLCQRLAKHFASHPVDGVLAPALGGIILSQWIAHHLSTLRGKTVFAVYSEKMEDDSFVIKRGYDKLLPGKNILVAEDVLNTGGSVLKVIQEAKKHRATVIGVAALCNRGAVTAQDLEVPEIKALIDVNLEAWEAKSCPLCQKKVPINLSVGKGREFLASHKT